ncbi:unnamed protein product [Arabidopsis halleri]
MMASYVLALADHSLPFLSLYLNRVIDYTKSLFSVGFFFQELYWIKTTIRIV